MMITKLVKCPACGATVKTKIPTNMDTVISCQYCSSLIHIDVDEPGIIESSGLDLKPVINLVKKIKLHHLVFFLALAGLIPMVLFYGISPDEQGSPVVDSKNFTVDEKSVPGYSGTGEFDPSVNGKYSELIQKVHCPGDRSSYGEFYDWGHWSGTRWCGKSVKPGYWVWVAPDWYIWKKKNR